MAELLDEGPFFHGTIAELRVGEFFTAGRPSNYRPEIVMNHIYFTSLVDGAGFAAEIAAELSKSDAIPRVYAVAPTGDIRERPERDRQEISRQPHPVVPQQCPTTHRQQDHRMDTTDTRTAPDLERTADGASLERTRRILN